jgi:hypothetical protein
MTLSSDSGVHLLRALTSVGESRSKGDCRAQHKEI